MAPVGGIGAIGTEQRLGEQGRGRPRGAPRVESGFIRERTAEGGRAHELRTSRSVRCRRTRRNDENQPLLCPQLNL